MSSKQTKKDPTFERLPTIEEEYYSNYKSQPETLDNKYVVRSQKKKYKKYRRQENRFNKKDSEIRSNASLLEFERQLANQTKYPPDEKEYRESILTSSSKNSTKKEEKEENPEKPKNIVKRKVYKHYIL